MLASQSPRHTPRRQAVATRPAQQMPWNCLHRLWLVAALMAELPVEYASPGLAAKRAHLLRILMASTLFAGAFSFWAQQMAA